MPYMDDMGLVNPLFVANLYLFNGRYLCMGPPAQEDPYLPTVRLANWLARPLVVSWAVSIVMNFRIMIHPESLSFSPDMMGCIATSLFFMVAFAKANGFSLRGMFPSSWGWWRLNNCMAGLCLCLVFQNVSNICICTYTIYIYINTCHLALFLSRVETTTY